MDAIALTSPDVSEDAAVVATCLREPARFEQIYLRHRPAIYRYLRASGLDEDAAGDVTASTFERAFRSLRQYRPDQGPLAAWLFGIARNLRADHHRTNERAHQRPVVPRDLPDMEDSVALRLAVASLPPASRDAIALRYGVGLTSREIGMVLGVGPEAVQKRIERALAELREALR